jgi:hypothetical protein
VKALVAEDRDFLKSLMQEAVQTILAVELTGFLGAEPSERTESRKGYRAGFYPRSLVTRIGKLELRVPRGRNGEFSTALFERYARAARRRWWRHWRRCTSRRVDPQGQGDHRGALRSHLLCERYFLHKQWLIQDISQILLK